MINPGSALAQEIWEKGYAADCPILDMHAHMFNHSGGYMIADTPEKMLAFMDRSNVKLTVFAGHKVLFGGPRWIENDLTVAQAYPDRFKLYHPVVSPLLNPEEDLRRVAEHGEYIGFKFLCDYYKVPLSDERHTPYWQYANDHHMPVLAHTWGQSPYNGPAEAEKVLSRWPGLSLLAGHSFRGDWEEAIALGKKYKNLYLEMTAVPHARNRFERFVEAGLIKQIVFGVDAPWFSYDAYVGAFLSADISDEDRRDIFYRNARGIFKKANLQIPGLPE